MSAERKELDSNIASDFVITAHGVKPRQGFTNQVLNSHKPELLDEDDFIVGDVDNRPRDYWKNPEFRNKAKTGIQNSGNGSTLLEDPVEYTKSALNDSHTRRMLTPQQRLVLAMRFVEGLTQHEVGEALKKSDRGISKIERRALLTIHNEQKGGGREIMHARSLLSLGAFDVEMIPGLTEREKAMLIGRCVEGKTNIQSAGELGISTRRASESYKLGLQKAAFFLREFRKKQAEDNPSSPQ